ASPAGRSDKRRGGSQDWTTPASLARRASPLAVAPTSPKGRGKILKIDVFREKFLDRAYARHRQFLLRREQPQMTFRNVDGGIGRQPPKNRNIPDRIRDQPIVLLTGNAIENHAHDLHGRVK